MTVRWGVVGPGRIADRFAKAMEMVPDGTIDAVVSRSIERARDYARCWDVARSYDDLDALAHDGALDAIYVATPHSRHEADSVFFLEAGKAVLCEKPFALNAAQATRMVDVARRNGAFLMEAMWSRFLPAYGTLAELLAQGRIGEPVTVEADFGFASGASPDHRLFNLELGGGALLDIGIYPVQLSFFVLGVPQRCVGFGTVGVTGSDDLAIGVLDHGAGRYGLVKAGLRMPMATTARISGTDGWVHLPARMHCPTSLSVHRDGETETFDAGWEGDGLRFEIDHVHRCLAEGRTESDVMPLSESIAIAHALDSIRADIGVVYPGELSGEAR